MKPKNIYLVRHGESEANEAKRSGKPYPYKPDYAFELTLNGRAQADLVGRELSQTVKSAAFYVSPYWRTRQTSLIIENHIQCVRKYEDPRLREQEFGTRINYNVNHDERDSYGHFYYRMDNGESCADVYDRVSDFLGTLWRDFEKPDFPENVIIVCHGMTMRVFLMRFFHLSVEEFEIIANPPNCGVYHLQLSGGKYSIPEVKRYENYNHNFQFKPYDANTST
jgi:broad specificity phosphatase PhoE